MQPTAWAVVDVETTGLHPVRDRIVEIAVVRLDADALVVDEWSTLVYPGDRAPLSRVHGISAKELAEAPPFAEVLPELLWLLSGHVVVAHNAPFDVAFLQSETVRSGVAWGPIEGLCTLALTRDLGLTKSRKLELSCQELGLSARPNHSALEDARAVAGILGHIASRLWAVPTPGVAPPWPEPPSRGRLVTRGQAEAIAPAPPVQRELSRLPIPTGLGIPDAAASTYMALLDNIVEDKRVTDSEVEALSLFAKACGISRDLARKLHVAYLDEMWRVARLDLVVTADERQELVTLTGLLTKALPR